MDDTPPRLALPAQPSLDVCLSESPPQHVRRNRQKHPSHHARDEYHGPPTFSRLGPAGEQFIKDTPWANPNHSAHKMYQQNHGQPAARADASATAGPAPQPGTGPPPAGVGAALDGQPAAHASPALPAALATRTPASPEVARNVANAAAAHSMKRAGSMPNAGRGPKTAAT